jgi:hypothetical protein
LDDGGGATLEEDFEDLALAAGEFGFAHDVGTMGGKVGGCQTINYVFSFLI